MKDVNAAYACGAWLPARFWRRAVPARPRAKVLRFVQNGNLTILDPIWTTAYVTRNHGYFIYDTLFAIGREQRRQAADGRQVRGLGRQDAVDLHPARRPRMARRHAGHLGGLHRLDQALGRARRDGPEAHGLREGVQGSRRQDLPDGAEGAVRPGARVARQAVVERAVHDAEEGRRDRSRSSRSTARSARARSSTSTPSPSPARSTSTSRTPSTSRAAEPPSGLAGGKVVKVDRVEIIEMPDPQQQVNALIAGEIDLIEQPPHDLIPILKKDKNVKLVDWNPLGHQFIIRFNHLPTAVQQSEDPPGRAATASRQEDYLKATVGEPRVLQGLHAPPSSAARPTPSTRRTACWSSRTSRSPRRCSRRRATTARRSC